MKAPEKIYLQPLGNNEIYNHWYTLKLNNDFIEYTRTEAFIDKACVFLETYPHMFMGMLRSDMIEDFKNYMKGE